MRGLLRIVPVAFVLFMVLAVAQEWRFFSASWFGTGVEEERLTEEDRRQAADTVVRTLSLMRHFYLSGGDPRFADRMPVSSGLLEELRTDVDYLARNHRLQDPELQRLQVLAVERVASAGDDRVEVRTRERWTFRVLWASDGSSAGGPRRRTVEGRYFLVRSGTGWRVEAWQPIAEESGAETAADGGPA